MLVEASAGGRTIVRYYLDLARRLRLLTVLDLSANPEKASGGRSRQRAGRLVLTTGGVVMTYGVVVDVAAPVEMYDALHREVLGSAARPLQGLLLHIGRATGEGFQVIEVWTDKDEYDRYNREVVWPAADRLAAGQSGPPPQMRTEEFEVRGLVLPGAELVR